MPWQGAQLLFNIVERKPTHNSRMVFVSQITSHERQIMSDAKEKKPPKFELILYKCPYCGMANLKDIEAVRNNDTWECPYCGCHLETA
jgi:predicted RNA-binding Zn-ribbon protein involved in translation (DUF1610 family)